MAYRYAGFEIRLRCSDDNRMESDVGGGYRFWGFMDWTAGSGLEFICASPESSADVSGFHALSSVGGYLKMWEPISEIDIRDWHTYTIIWEPENATFLVDGEIVANTTQAPRYNMNAGIENTNLALSQAVFQSGVFERIAIPFNESIQVDYVHVFGVSEILPILAMIYLPVLFHPRRPGGRRREFGGLDTGKS
jgi:hypothetical protein